MFHWAQSAIHWFSIHLVGAGAAMAKAVTLRPEQIAAVDHAADFLTTAGFGAKRVYAQPTGTGKSYVLVELLTRFPDAYLVCPTVEIIAGLLDKMGVKGVPLSRVGEVAESYRIFTPIRLRNLLAAGTVRQPGKLLFDEVHHAEAETYKLLDAYCGSVPSLGFTATAFRGTPKSTGDFIAAWGQPVTVMTFAEAAQLGRLSTPAFRTQPLIDDDKIDVTNGEFVVKRLTEAVGDNVGFVAEMARKWYDCGWDRPTMFTVPSVASATMLAVRLNESGLPAAVVTGETPPREREAAFRDVVARHTALVQINVVSEGVDLPIRRLVDLRPTLSPVLFMQTLGRITRPVTNGEDAPEYVCCCRNLLRHAYLLAGAVPASAVRDAEQAFGGPGVRAGLRAVGFVGLGRFKATELPLVDGTTGVLYVLQKAEGLVVTEYVIMAAPNKLSSLVATRTNTRKNSESETRRYDTQWGKWAELDEMPDVTDGFASASASRPVSENMKAFWKKHAGHRGLNPDAEFNARQFQALPVLLDIGRKLVG